MAAHWPFGGNSLGRDGRRPALIRAALLICVLTLTAVAAQAPWATVTLRPGPGIALPAAAFRVLTGLPADTPYAAVADRLAAGDGMAGTGRVLAAGLTWDKLWAETALRNDGPDPATWQLRTALVAAGELQVLLLRESGPPETLLSASFRDGFDTRPVDSRRLISAPFELAPGETARLAIGYRPLGFSRLPLWLAQPGDMQVRLAAQARGDAVFYTATGVLIACFLGFCLVIRNRAGVYFAGLLVLNLAVVAQIEGHLFRHLWPGAPLFNLNATLPLILLASAFGYLTTLQAGRGALRPGEGRGLMVAIGLCLLHLAALPFANPALTVPGTFALWIGTFAAFVMTLNRWTRFTPLQRRIGQGVAAGMVGFAALALSASLSADAPVWMTSDLLLRLSYLLASGGLMTLLLMQVSGLYRAHQDGLQARIVAARTEADLNAALLQSERGYTEAMRRAASAGQRLASASHDIQQPLSALRLLLRQPASTRSDDAVADALSYLDRLAAAFSGAQGDDPEPDKAEAYDPGMVLSAVADMFRDEAGRRGIEVSVSSAPGLTTVPTLTLMRIVSNLTVNAIRHSGGSLVTLSLTVPQGRESALTEISVTNDGAAMTAAEFTRYQTTGAKGPDSDGDGLGLAIVADLCAANGLTLSLDDTVPTGTRLIVTLPAATADPA